MFLEWLYPKQMQVAITKLRGENDLNEIAIEHLTRELVVLFLSIVFYGVFLSLLYRPFSITLFLFISLGIFSVLKYALHTYYKFLLLPYLIGEIKEGIITKVEHRLPLNTSFVCELTNSCDSVEIWPDRAFSRLKPPLKKGGVVRLYVARDRHRAMPDIPEIKKVYCLKLSEIVRSRI